MILHFEQLVSIWIYRKVRRIKKNRWLLFLIEQQSHFFHLSCNLFFTAKGSSKILNDKWNVTIMCRNDELSSTMSWVVCLLKDSELFILFAKNSQILLKISVIPILLTFNHHVALNLLVNNQLNSLSNSTHHCGT